MTQRVVHAVKRIRGTRELLPLLGMSPSTSPFLLKLYQREVAKLSTFPPSVRQGIDRATLSTIEDMDEDGDVPRHGFTFQTSYVSARRPTAPTRETVPEPADAEADQPGSDGGFLSWFPDLLMSFFSGSSSGGGGGGAPGAGGGGASPGGAPPGDGPGGGGGEDREDEVVKQEPTEQAAEKPAEKAAEASDVEEDAGPTITVDEIKAAAVRMDPADKGRTLTKAGRALKKHAKRPGDVFFARVPLDASDKVRNDRGKEVVDEILADIVRTRRLKKRKLTDYWDSKGQGLRMNDAKEFVGLLNPPINRPTP